MYYQKIFSKNRIDRCNVCNQPERDMAWDHVPPKGGIDLVEVEVRHMMAFLQGDNAPKKPLVSQNGVKFRTICRDCNTKFGQRFDPSINRFGREIKRVIDSSLVMPSQTIHVREKPDRIARAVLGHLLSAKINVEDSAFDDEVRGFIFDDTVPIPETMNVYYWVFPFNTTIISRDVGLMEWRGGETKISVGSLLKYLPVAFFVTREAHWEGLPNLRRLCNPKDPMFETDIPIDLGNTRAFDWPEKPEGTRAAFYGATMQEAIQAVPRVRPQR